jgi:hypothetical protein
MNKIVTGLILLLLAETMWSVDNPAYLLMSRLSEVLAEGLGKK